METTTNLITQSTTNSTNLRWILTIILILIVCYVIIKYNKLVWFRNLVRNAFADIDAQMQLRFDLVDNLVNTVKGYAIHEKETLTQVIQARNSCISATDDNEKASANSRLTNCLKNLFAVSEKYPELKANQNYLELQSELSDIENKIAAARRFYNSCVKDYNTAREIFPNNIIAKLFWFKEEKLFSVSDKNAKKPVKIDLN